MIKRVITFFNEVKLEFKKVTWSTKEELIGSTAVVIVAIAVLATFVGLADAFLSTLITLIFKAF